MHEYLYFIDDEIASLRSKAEIDRPENFLSKLLVKSQELINHMNIADNKYVERSIMLDKATRADYAANSRIMFDWEVERHVSDNDIYVGYWVRYEKPIYLKAFKIVSLIDDLLLVLINFFYKESGTEKFWESIKIIPPGYPSFSGIDFANLVDKPFSFSYGENVCSPIIYPFTDREGDIDYSTAYLFTHIVEYRHRIDELRHLALNLLHFSIHTYKLNFNK